MDKTQLKRQRQGTKPISLRIDRELLHWLRKEDLSPTKIFNAACQELGYKPTNKPEVQK